MQLGYSLAAIDLVRQIIETRNFWIGVRHIFSPTPVSKYELVQMIADVYKLKGTTMLPFTEGRTNDKTLSSVYPVIFEIPELRDQLIEQIKTIPPTQVVAFTTLLEGVSLNACGVIDVINQWVVDTNRDPSTVYIDTPNQYEQLPYKFARIQNLSH